MKPVSTMHRGSPATPLLGAIRKDRALVMALVLLYGLLAGFVGFAHVATAGPGAKAPILCLTSDDGSIPEGSASSPCDACLLTHAPGLVAVHAAELPQPAFVHAGVVLSVSQDIWSAPRVRAPPARGPPSAVKVFRKA
jgi:hypothetical protein